MVKKISKPLKIAIIILVVLSMVVSVSYLTKPGEISTDHNFLKESDTYAKIPGLGPYDYQSFHLKVGGVTTTLALGFFGHAGFNHSHTMPIPIKFNFTKQPCNLELASHFNLVMIGNNSNSIGIKLTSLVLFNKTISYEPPCLTSGSPRHNTFYINWGFPNKYEVNPNFNYIIRINLELYKEFGPFYYPEGNYVLNATQFPINICE